VKYMLTMQARAKDWESMSSWTPGEFKAHIQFMMDLNAELSSSGELLQAEGLDVPANARVVKATQADAPIVSDGPFAETKEFLAGFWIVQVPSLERATAIAAKASTAPGPGGKPMAIPIEVRQVGSVPDMA